MPLFKNYVREAWVNEWTKEAMGRGLQHYLPILCIKNLRVVLQNIAKVMASIHAQMRTHRIGLPTFLYQIDVVDTSMYAGSPPRLLHTFCSNARETTDLREIPTEIEPA